MLERRVARDERRVGPWIHAIHAQRDRQEQHGHQRKHARGRADGTADDDTPGAARQLMHHAEREAAERDAEPQHVRHQVRLQELGRVEETAGERQHRAHGADEQQPILEAFQLRNRNVGGLRQGLVTHGHVHDK